MKRRMCVHNVIVLIAAFLCIGMLTVTSAATVKESNSGSEKFLSVSEKKKAPKKKATRKAAAKKQSESETEVFVEYYGQQSSVEEITNSAKHNEYPVSR